MNKLLFIFFDGSTLPASAVCSGALPVEMGGQPCPFSEGGRPPAPVPLTRGDSIDKGLPGDLCPPCAKHQLGPLGHWQGHYSQQFPDELLPLRLFKCRQWFWMVVPGLRDDNPTRVETDPEAGNHSPIAARCDAQAR